MLIFLVQFYIPGKLGYICASQLLSPTPVLSSWLCALQTAHLWVSDWLRELSFCGVSESTASYTFPVQTATKSGEIVRTAYIIVHSAMPETLASGGRA